MPKRKNDPIVRQKAVTKYRRQRTIVNKMLELAGMRDLKISLLVYDPKQHKLQEIFTHKDVKLHAINQMINDSKATCEVKTRASKKLLKFESHDARLKYRKDEELEQDHDDVGDGLSEETHSLS